MNSIDEVSLPRLPSGLPQLDRGKHQRPEFGACVMEYVSILSGNRFSDHPPCTDSYLAWLARAVNDTLSDSTRGCLATRAPALIDTQVPRETACRIVVDNIIEAARRHDPDLVLSRLLDRSGAGGRRTARWRYSLVDRGNLFARLCTILCEAGEPYRDGRLVQMLDLTIGEFRRHSGLPPVPLSTVPDSSLPRTRP